MKDLKLPGFAIVAIGAAITALVNYFGSNGAGSEWLYAPIAVAVLGTLGSIINTNKAPTVEPSAAVSRGEAEPAQPTKLQRFFLG